MTLDEAIKHFEEVAIEKEVDRDIKRLYSVRNNKNLDGSYDEACKRIGENRQIAEWLKELKKDRELLDSIYNSMLFE